MTYSDAVVLGIVQGITEFVPISSDGHLVLAQALLGVQEPGIGFEVMVHVGTLFSVLIYFRKKLWGLIKAVFDSSKVAERKTILLIILATIPLAVCGVLFDDFYESFFSPLYTGVFLVINGFILISTKLVKQGNRNVGMREALIMGAAQAFAPFPGISRSGTTISAGLLAGTKASDAAEFSFLLLIPAVCGALVLKAGEFAKVPSEHMPPYLVACVVSFLAGLAAVAWLLRMIRRGKFEYFAYYCFAIGLLVIVLSLRNGP